MTRRPRRVAGRWGAGLLALSMLACGGGDGTGPGSVGTLQVVVEGLPTDVPAAVTVTGPGGFSRTITATEQLAQLRLGTYTIAATGVENARSRWRVTPETQQVTLSASSAGATQRVTYEVTTGALLLQIVGLPAGALADVELRPPSGPAQPLTSTTTFEKLAPGRYVVAGRTVRAGGHAWLAPDSLQTIDLTARAQPLVVQVAYTVGSGTLAVQFEQLPAGTTAQVEVRGPGGFVRQLTQSDSLVGIAPGAYTLTASPVSKDGEQYDASTPVRQVTVLPSTTAQLVRFIYGRSSARLTIDVRGLPVGVSGSVFVRGPGGFAQAVATTERLVGLPPGSYVVSASVVVTPGGSFSATPLEQTVDLAGTGSEAAVQVAYVRVTGSLSIGVAGLPSGVPAAITVSGPNGFSEQVTAPRVLGNLAPGTYTVTAAAVTGGGTLYAPSPASQQVVVTTGNTAAVAVTYAASVGALAITVAGLPPGANAAITVLGPGGPYVVLASAVLGPLQPGAYTVNASPVQVGGTLYTAAPATQVANVTASPTPVAVSVTYTSAVGSLAVQIGGLPPGAAASVQVTGPGGFSQVLTASSTLTGLAPGSYTLTAAPVTVGGTLYTVTPSSQSVTVVAGSQAQVTMTYAPVGGSGLNLTVDAAYVVQAVQSWSGSVPLVAGRDGVVRVFVRASATNTVQPQVRVRIYSGNTVVHTLVIAAPAASVPTAVSETPLSSSWNATVSGTFLQPGYRLLADVDPGGQVAESNESDNAWPASGTPQTLDIRPANTFQIRFVPVHISANGLTGSVNAGNVQQFLGYTRKVWPLQQVDVDVRSAYTTNAPPLQSNDGNGAWSQILGELNFLRTADGSSRYYMGVVRTTYTSGVAGLGYVPGRAALTWDFLPSADEITAHELGHNFSRLHAPCGGPAGVDPNYPYQNAAIGVYGLDLALNALKVPTQPDVMSYCSNTWVSDYNWVAVMNYRAANPGARIAAAGGAPGGRSLLVWGRINGRGITVEPAFTLGAVTPALPQGRGSARLEVLDGAGRVLYTAAFEPEALADGRDPAERHFTFAIPLGDAALQAMRVVRVTAGGRRAERRSPQATAGRQQEVPRLVRSGRRAGEVRVEWDGPTVQGVLVRDGATGEILALLRDRPGYTGRGSGEVELLVSDGVHTQVLRRQAPR